MPKVTGPISLSAYMRQCLTSELGGYYTSSHGSDDQFGKKGDFITSPEISQVFGELVAIWFLSEMMAQVGRTQVRFIELGPGRGTLMSDILRTANQFSQFRTAIRDVWMVEAGEALRQKQCEVLCGTTHATKKQEDIEGKMWTWWEARAKQEYGGAIIKWVEDIVLLPPSAQAATDASPMPLILAHEFFDALPIQAFESVAPKPEEERKPQLLDDGGQPMVRPSSASKTPQWRELLVTTTKRKPELKDMLRTEAEAERDQAKAEQQGQDDFRLTLAHASTPASLVLPERPRYRHLKSQVGSRIEISPDSARYAGTIAKLIGNQQTPAGAALIIDYGPADTIPIDSLRGIRQHSIVSPFKHAGQADLSADVDFLAVADAALEASEGVEVHGPVEQGQFLSQLGIKLRAERLMKSMTSNASLQGNGTEDLQEKIQNFEAGWKRLVEGGPKGMGKAYKVMAVLPENGGKRRPVAFGGNVAS
jgi:NADH dehydrogenase [ubiquinone] 1 alpha subcomplex assembly factor 7